MSLYVINVVYLGRVDYSTALELQQTVVQLVKDGRISHTLLLLEHPPVITLGRNAGLENIIASRESLASQGIELHETNRGGNVTFHGPGQLVGYPIFDLRAFEPRFGRARPQLMIGQNGIAAFEYFLKRPQPRVIGWQRSFHAVEF